MVIEGVSSVEGVIVFDLEPQLTIENIKIKQIINVIIFFINQSRSINNYEYFFLSKTSFKSSNELQLRYISFSSNLIITFLKIVKFLL